MMGLAWACTAGDRGKPADPAPKKAAPTGSENAGTAAALVDELAHGSTIVFGTDDHSVLQLLGPGGSTRFALDSGEYVQSVIVTSEGAVALTSTDWAQQDLLKIVDDRGNVISTVPCLRCYSLYADEHGGVWSMSADAEYVDGVLRHFDRRLETILDVPVLHVTDTNAPSSFERTTSPELAYSDGDGVVIQNVATDGVYRGGPFNLARLGTDGRRSGVLQVALRVRSAVPNADNSLVALTTRGSGGACSVVNEIEFLDPRSFTITRKVDLTLAILGPQQSHHYTSIIAGPGQWVGDLYLAHAESLDGYHECGVDRGWVLVDPATGSVRVVPSSDIAAALRLSAEPEWVVSYDGSCDRLVFGRRGGAVELVSRGREFQIISSGNYLAGGQPLPPSCFGALIDQPVGG